MPGLEKTDPQLLEPPVSQRRRRRLRGRHRAGRRRGQRLRHGCRRRATTTTTATRTSSWPACAGTRLFRNNGNGTFTDVTEAAGLARPDPEYGTLWAVAAAFADYDRDGWLDLFVSNYCVWDPKTEPHLRRRRPRATTAIPTLVPGPAQLPLPQQPRRHLRATCRSPRASARTSARAWASAWRTSTTTAGRTSSSRTTRCRRLLFMNSATGRSRRRRHGAAWPYTESGRPISGMGADARDVDNDGLPDIFQTALAHRELPALQEPRRRRPSRTSRRSRASAR